MEQNIESSRKQLSFILFVGGAAGLIFGGILLMSYLSSDTDTSLSDAGLNAGFGLLEILAGWFITKGKRIAILFVVAAILASLVYSFLAGRGLNYYMLVMGGLFLVWAISLWRRGGLS